MIRVIPLLIALAAAGCANRMPGLVSEPTAMRPACVDNPSRERLATFIIDCVSAASDGSVDSDTVKQCERSGVLTVCPQVRHCYNSDAQVWEYCGDGA